MSEVAPTLTDVHDRLATVRSEITRLGVKRLALFGSVRHNAARPNSDVDLLVEFLPGGKTYRHFFALGELLEQLFARRVELVTPESLSPFLHRRISAEATDVFRAA